MVKFVNLANRVKVDVHGIATALVQFEKLQLSLDFVVLDCNVPAILGMDFLA